MIQRRPADQAYCWRQLDPEEKERALMEEIRRCQQGGWIHVHEWIADGTLALQRIFRIKANAERFRREERRLLLEVEFYDDWQLTIVHPADVAELEVSFGEDPADPGFTKIGVGPLRTPEEMNQ